MTQDGSLESEACGLASRGFADLEPDSRLGLSKSSIGQRDRRQASTTATGGSKCGKPRSSD